MRAVFLVAPLLLGSAACATGGAVDAELSRMRRQMHGLEKEVKRQRLEIERLEGRVTLLSLGAEPSRAQPTEPVSSQTAQPSAVRPERGPERPLPVVRMTAKAGATRTESVVPWDDPGAQDDGSPPVLIKLGPSAIDSTERLPVDKTVLAKPDPVLSKRAKKERAARPAASKKQIRRAYDDALTTLREGNDAEGALVQFEAFVESHPDSRLADNALYWTGECHRALARPAEAAEVFARLLRSHPRSAKVPYAKVGLGISRIELGARAKGEALLREVIERHPTSGAANEAKAYLAAGQGE